MLPQELLRGAAVVFVLNLLLLPRPVDADMHARTHAHTHTWCRYGLALLDFLGLGVLIQITFHPQTDPHPLMTIGLIMMFYGLYFGVLVRDFAEICAGSMASVIGYYNKDGAMPKLQLNDDVRAHILHTHMPLFMSSLSQSDFRVPSTLVDSDNALFAQRHTEKNNSLTLF